MSRIKTYEDLEAEKLRLTSLLKIQEENIKTDIAGVREGLKPVGNVVSFLDKIATKDKTAVPVMRFGVDMGIDILLRRVLLKNAHWLARVVIPTVVKNYSSHIIGDEIRDKIREKLTEWFKKIRPKPEPHTTTASYTPAADTTAHAATAAANEGATTTATAPTGASGTTSTTGTKPSGAATQEG